MSVDFKSEEEVKEFIKNLGIEYRFGCFKEKKPEVCHLLGDYLESIDKNFEKAFKIYQSNCDSANNGRSCYKCGSYLAMGKGGAKKDLQQATNYFEKSCGLGEMDGCFRAGLLSVLLSKTQSQSRSIHDAVKLFEKGCEGNNHEACYHLSSIFLEGYEKDKIAKDMKRSFEYALKACDLNNMYACANLSLMYKNGEGVEKDQKLSEKYKLKARDLQDDVIKQRQLEFQEGLSRT